MRSIKAALCVAIGALGLSALPAAAGAASLQQPVGTLVPVGTSITMASTNTTFATELGTITCQSLTFRAWVVRNAGSSVVAEGEGEGTPSVCSLGTNSIQQRHWKLNQLILETGNQTLNMSFEWLLPGGLTCRYETDNPVLTYVPGSSSLRLNSALTASPALCGEETSMSGDFELTAGANKPVYLY